MPTHQYWIEKKVAGEILNLNQKFFSKIGFSYLIYAICTIAFPIIIFHIIGNGFEIVNNINFRLVISSICNYILPFPILLFLMKKLEREKLEKESLSITSFLLYFCISFTLMIIGNLIGIGGHFTHRNSNSKWHCKSNTDTYKFIRHTVKFDNNKHYRTYLWRTFL